MQWDGMGCSVLLSDGGFTLHLGSDSAVDPVYSLTCTDRCVEYSTPCGSHDFKVRSASVIFLSE
jgi:hypothetical protein